MSARLIQLIGFVCFMLCFNSCSYLDSLNKKGDIVTKEVDISSFNRLIIDASYEIIFTKEESFKIKFEGYDYLMDDVMVELEDGLLTLDHKKATFIKQSKMIKAYIYAPDLNSITINSPINLSSEEELKADVINIVANGGADYTDLNLGLECNRFVLRVYGPSHVGNYTFSGSCNNMDVNLEGISVVDAKHLDSKTTFVNHKSRGDCTVSCSEKLSVKIHSSGHTYYCGTPELSIEKIGEVSSRVTGQVYSTKKY